MKDLEAIGFKVNPYDPCVSNNMIRDKKMKITWNVDDLEVYHADKDIVHSLIE